MRHRLARVLVNDAAFDDLTWRQDQPQVFALLRVRGLDEPFVLSPITRIADFQLEFQAGTKMEKNEIPLGVGGRRQRQAGWRTKGRMLLALVLVGLARDASDVNLHPRRRLALDAKDSPAHGLN